VQYNLKEQTAAMMTRDEPGIHWDVFSRHWQGRMRQKAVLYLALFGTILALGRNSKTCPRNLKRFTYFPLTLAETSGVSQTT